MSNEQTYYQTFLPDGRQAPDLVPFQMTESMKAALGTQRTTMKYFGTFKDTTTYKGFGGVEYRPMSLTSYLKSKESVAEVPRPTILLPPKLTTFAVRQPDQTLPTEVNAFRLSFTIPSKQTKSVGTQTSLF